MRNAIRSILVLKLETFEVLDVEMVPVPDGDLFLSPPTVGTLGSLP